MIDILHTNNGYSSPIPHIVIIGGGITGLSAAFYLEREAQARGLAIRYTLIEREKRWGGKLLTDTVDDFVIEGGPDSFITQKPWGVQLARDLGLGDQLIPISERRGKVYVFSRGRLQPMPDGMMLIVPTRIMPFALSPLISPVGKLRMALDLVLPARRDSSDETVADFIRRRLGREALDKLAEPLLSGIHNSETERQSIMATFPRLREVEARHGSLIRGMVTQRAASLRRQATSARPSTPLANSPFVTLKNGVAGLTNALVQSLTGRLINGRGVATVAHDPTASRPYRIHLDDGERLDADIVMLTAPAYTAADLVESFLPRLATGLRQIRYVSTGTVSLAYRRADVGTLMDGYGVVIPRTEGRRINAITISSSKFAHRAPDDSVLLRVFVGGSRNPDVMDLEDTALLALVQAELRTVLGLQATPLFSRIYRWPRANPQYDVGHLEHMNALERLCPPGLLLSGSAYRGVGIPDCAHQGQQAAMDALAYVDTLPAGQYATSNAVEAS